jgi:excisionase family DNA binding protein
MQLITISQAANRCAISARMVWKLIQRTELPVVRVGRCVRLREDDVEALVRRGYTDEVRAITGCCDEPDQPC